ncbi:glycerophosphodiester phosphodiesterase family protein [candidate division KSB1 bacterium]|nr:glycerophosphodiester phosphodiesterase family protein [candidate division KSB1 bacterium]
MNLKINFPQLTFLCIFLCAFFLTIFCSRKRPPDLPETIGSQKTIYDTTAMTRSKNLQSPLKPPKNGNFYVIAHRGAHNEIPENSIPAYRKAIELGVDFVEVDIRMSKDGEFVSIHNRSIDAYVPGKTGEVEKMTLAELLALDIGSRIGPQWKDTRIPTFEEILRLCKGKCGIYLDLKKAPIEPLTNLIKKFEMEHDVIWCLADRKALEEVRRCCPECILMPDPDDEESFAAILDEFKPWVVAPVWRDFSRRLVEMSHRAGALVFVDEHDKDSWQQAIEWGADGIQTDHPAELIEYIRKVHESQSSDIH